MGAANRLRPRASGIGFSEQIRNARLTNTRTTVTLNPPPENQGFCQSLARQEFFLEIRHHQLKPEHPITTK
jgi:hypothetical protein